MEEWVRTVLFVGGAVCVFGLVTAIGFCAGLSDIVHWNSCNELLALSAQVARRVALLAAQLQAAVTGR